MCISCLQSLGGAPPPLNAELNLERLGISSCVVRLRLFGLLGIFVDSMLGFVGVLQYREGLGAASNLKTRLERR